MHIQHTTDMKQKDAEKVHNTRYNLTAEQRLIQTSRLKFLNNKPYNQS